MSRILKRPMFRIGGSTNEGIVSMAQPRRQYANSNYEDLITQFPKSKELIEDAQAKAALMSAFAGSGRSQDERLSNLLIRGGLKTMSETPRGGLFATVSKAFEQPVDEYLKSGEAEDSFQRQLRLAGLTQAMTSLENKSKLDLERQVLEEKKKEAELKLNPSKAPIYDILKGFEKKGIKTYEITSVIGSGDKIKPSPQAVANIPIGGVFHDPSNNLYLRVPKEKSSVGWVRLDRSGQEIVVQAPEKKPGFFDSPGAAYDPRSWNKQKFYETLANKNKTSTVE
jgi:hypothetical protein